MSHSLKWAWIGSIGLAILATVALLTLRPFVEGVTFAPDQGFNWYYWKRPDPDAWSRASMWGGYVLHQLFLWGVIAWAQTNRDRLRERGKIHVINWIALGGTGFFVALHYVQTALFYDGLGQDLPVITSQGSVVLVLVVVLIMEAPRRGLFFGRAKLFRGIRQSLIRYHGYYFAWAVTFTYWYHPMELTAGHLAGFFYTFLLFIQAAFIFTRVHTNRWWTFALEGAVLIHGVIVALVAGQDFWTMFLFGFLVILVVTQMHGLGLKRWIRWAIGLGAVASILWVYRGEDWGAQFGLQWGGEGGRGWGAVHEVLRIPVIDYVLVFMIAGLVLLLQKVLRKAS
ncbi:MAG: hypothetical protein ACRBCL_00505 [Maritimibacter sp.]